VAKVGDEVYFLKTTNSFTLNATTAQPEKFNGSFNMRLACYRIIKITQSISDIAPHLGAPRKRKFEYTLISTCADAPTVLPITATHEDPLFATATELVNWIKSEADEMLRQHKLHNDRHTNVKDVLYI